MTAPKMIWAWEYQGQHGQEGQWRGSAMSAITGSARYIRADAPELVALVAALRECVVVMELVDGENDCSRGIDAADAALAAWEALK